MALNHRATARFGRREPSLPRGRDIALTGFVVTAVTFGPARMSFGLHLPQLREEFALSSTVAGMIGAGVFAAFLVAAVAASWLTAALGPRISVLTGCGAAFTGLALTTLAPGPLLVATGVVAAGAGAGLCWSPFNDAAARSLAEPQRGTPLSLVSTGTTIGIAAAGGAQLLLVLAGVGWRWAWASYAVAAAVAGLLALVRLPPMLGRAEETGVTPRHVRRLGRALVWPVLAASSFGATSSLYLAFAADVTTAAGGLPGLPSPAGAGVLFVAYGVAGLVGLSAASIEHRSGLRTLLLLVFSASAASLLVLALAPATWGGALTSASLQGGATMVVSALLSFWTARLFPGAASMAFTVVVASLAAGGVVGPALAGLLLDPLGATTVFAGAAALSALTGVLLAVAHPPIRATPAETGATP